jgi:DHA1 family bicyclomycin/chloramphenicol resistance-like MFS transporter
MKLALFLRDIPFHILFALVTTIIAVDLYIPNLPQMMVDLNTSREMIQFSMTIAIFSSSIMTFFLGPLSDAIGRRPFLLVGQIIYALSSFSAAFVPSLEALLVLRLLQGASGVGAMVLTFAVISDRYHGNEALRYYAYSTTAITLSLVLAPLIGVFFGEYFTWRASFLFLGILASLSAISIYFFVPETLKTKKPYQLKESLVSYVSIIQNGRFLTLALIPALLLGINIAFYSIGAFYFINELGLSVGIYGLYQGIIMLINSLMSALTARAVEMWGGPKALALGIYLLGVGALSFLLICVFIPEPKLLVILAIAVYSAGLGFSWSVFLSDSMRLFPEKSGTVASTLSIIRGWIIGISVTSMSFIYHKSLLPVSIIMFFIMGGCYIAYRQLYKSAT